MKTIMSIIATYWYLWALFILILLYIFSSKIRIFLREISIFALINDSIENIKKRKEDAQNKINMNICPKCNGSLVYKRSRYGSFMGCSNYPKCKFILK
jgi:hypothetical protein